MVKKEDKKYHLMSDQVARILFKKSKVSKELTAHIISEVLKLDYLEVLNNLEIKSEETAFNVSQIDSRTDVNLENKDYYITIEICYTKGSVRQRQTDTYVYQLYLGQVYKRESLKNMKKVVQIILENYDYFHQDKFIYEVVFMEKNTHIVEDDFIKKYHINLAKLKNVSYNSIRNEDNILKKILYMFVCKEDELEKAYEGDTFMEKVVKEARTIAGFEDVPLYFESEEEIKRLDIEEAIENGRKMGYEEGLEKGRKDGITQKQNEMIKDMYKNNISIEMISKVTELAVNEINDIIKNNM